MTPAQMTVAQSTAGSAALPGTLKRIYATFVKELIQLRRDRITFATMIFIPVFQLLLFGYAINTDPKHLPTAVLVQDDSAFTRSFLSAMRASDYFDVVRRAASESELDGLLLSGDIQFGVQIPANFGRDVMRGDRPALLVIADATDPVATGGAVSALQGLTAHVFDRELVGPCGAAEGRPAAFRAARASPLQPGRRNAAQHRAGSHGHHPDADHADLHGAVGDARDRARHHGEPACHADPPRRDHAGQDRPLRCHRRRPDDADPQPRVFPVRGADRRQPRRCSSR